MCNGFNIVDKNKFNMLSLQALRLGACFMLLGSLSVIFAVPWIWIIIDKSKCIDSGVVTYKDKDFTLKVCYGLTLLAIVLIFVTYVAFMCMAYADTLFM